MCLCPTLRGKDIHHAPLKPQRKIVDVLHNMQSNLIIQSIQSIRNPSVAGGDYVALLAVVEKHHEPSSR